MATTQVILIPMTASLDIYKTVLAKATQGEVAALKQDATILTALRVLLATQKLDSASFRTANFARATQCVSSIVRRTMFVQTRP